VSRLTVGKFLAAEFLYCEDVKSRVEIGGDRRLVPQPPGRNEGDDVCLPEEVDEVEGDVIRLWAKEAHVTFMVAASTFPVNLEPGDRVRECFVGRPHAEPYSRSHLMAIRVFCGTEAPYDFFVEGRLQANGPAHKRRFEVTLNGNFPMRGDFLAQIAPSGALRVTTQFRRYTTTEKDAELTGRTLVDDQAALLRLLLSREHNSFEEAYPE
jgi:hypothetical protein